jgi:hypothetical protein
VVVTEDVLGASVCHKRAQSAAATESAAVIIHIAAGNAEMLVSYLVISATVGQTGCQ